MSPQHYYTLQRYAMKMLRDPDDRDELVLQAWQESNRLGPKSSMPLLVNYMKLRARENKRSIVGTKYGGKSIRDAWHYNPVSLSAPVADGHATLGDFVAGYDRDPLGQCVVAGFGDALSAEESKVAEQMISGYSDTEAARNLRMNPIEHHRVKLAVREKAIEHLV
jgi:hypothetical protein